ncbi:hypothetical protein SC383S_05545 [Aggregatibacter actinomycetemcomitans SC383s]|nr:hypothetical protein SC383S_05545 [Aggregatibacter actinomycetemcomitans SC383s]
MPQTDSLDQKTKKSLLCHCKTPNKMRKRNKLGRMLNQAGISGTKPMKTRVQEKTASFFIEE